MFHRCESCKRVFETQDKGGLCPRCGAVWSIGRSTKDQHDGRPNATINRPSDSLLEGLPFRSIDDDSDRIWIRYPSLKFICNFNNVVGLIYGFVGTLACIGFLFIGLQQSGLAIPAAIFLWFCAVLIPTLAIFASSELVKIAVRCEVHLRDVSEQLKKK